MICNKGCYKTYIISSYKSQLKTELATPLTVLISFEHFPKQQTLYTRRGWHTDLMLVVVNVQMFIMLGLFARLTVTTSACNLSPDTHQSQHFLFSQQ